MRKFFIILLATLLALMTFACGKKEDAFMEKYKDYEKTADFTLLCDLGFQKGTTAIGEGNVVAVSFELSPDTCLESITAYIGGYTQENCVRVASVYKFNKDYETTLKSKPVAKSTVDFFDASYTRTTFVFNEGSVQEGSYICTFTMPSGSAEIQLAARNEAGHQTYVNGFDDGSTAVMSYITFNKYTLPSSPSEAPALTKLTPGKAHVILLTGQSNASGQSYIKFLNDSGAPAEIIEQAEKGFDNVLIKYDVDRANVSKKFVPVKLGQGGGTDRFGPEIGLAYTLSQKYPGETFYILKYSQSGAGLTKHFQDTSGEWQYLSAQIKSALKTMSKDGLDPEVFAVLWMQGETDSWYVLDTLTYADKQEDFINRLKKIIKGYEAPNGFSFIDAAISNSGCWTFNNLINTQKKICDARDPNWHYLDTLAENLNCLKENNDIAHYDTFDEIRLGELFGEKVAEVIEKK